jgi:hypothetical protein
MSNSNGNKTKADTPTNPDSVEKPSDEQLVNQTLDDMQETERCHVLSDLELIAEILDDDALSLDPRVHELMTRIHPDWTNDITSAGPNPIPSYIALAVPYNVAYDVATFDDCHCNQSLKYQGNKTLYRPCITCAVRDSLFCATKDNSFAPEKEEPETKSE